MVGLTKKLQNGLAQRLLDASMFCLFLLDPKLDKLVERFLRIGPRLVQGKLESTKHISVKRLQRRFERHSSRQR